MTRRTLFILIGLYCLIVAGLFWLSTSPMVRAMLVTVEVKEFDMVLIPIEPEVVAEFEDDMPRTVNPQGTLKASESN